MAVTVMQYAQLLRVSTPQVEFVLDFTPNWLFVGYIFWFCLGLVFGFHVQVFSGWLARYRWALLTAAVALLVAGVVEWEAVLGASPEMWLGQKRLIVDELYSGAAILSFLAFGGLSIPWAKQLGELGAKSYGVYLSHILFQEWGAKVTYHVAPGLLALPVVFMLGLAVLGLAAPLTLMWAIRRSPVNRYYKYVFG